MTNLRLHRKYGVNPTVAMCCLCGGDTGEVALLGANYPGEAPHRLIVSPEPCKACRTKYLTEGTLLFALSGEGAPQTIGVVVLSDEAYRRLSTCDPPASKIAHVTSETMDALRKMLQPEAGEEVKP
jgi:hypothetical protein